ncbi:MULTISPECIES: hypothetical protein [Moorena]|nr:MULTISPECIES: hypothetical protein [Moorena]NEP31893.1 hypothetical protein [Moorena sp. SIO3B2]NEQ07350.1 hypothetical protein [Moorena sp. SIO4E2]NER88826.1 hypothetical protein [Moorena sp. SIO3A2]
MQFSSMVLRLPESGGDFLRSRSGSKGASLLAWPTANRVAAQKEHRIYNR